MAVSNYSNDDLVAMIANLNPEQREALLEKLLPDMDPAVVADLQAVAQVAPDTDPVVDEDLQSAEQVAPDAAPVVVAAAVGEVENYLQYSNMNVAKFENEIGFPGWTSAAKEDVAHALDMAKSPQLTPKGFAVNTDEEDEEQENSMSGPQLG